MLGRGFANVLGAVLLWIASLGNVLGIQPALDSATLAREQALRASGDVRLHFEINAGQFDSRVRFLARGPNYRIFLTDDDAVIAMDHTSSARDAERTNLKIRSTAIRLKFLDASRNVPVIGESVLASRSNYFRGSNPKGHTTDITHYGRVRYTQIYPGIDVVFYGNQRDLEYDFVIAPGADPRQIRLAVEGAEIPTIDSVGNLVLRSSFGEIKQHRPSVYQNVDGGRIAIPADYVINHDRTIGVQLAAYDRSKTLIIDPILSYSTFLGGSSGDFGSAVAVDATGNVYVAGYTASTDFPTLNAYDTSRGSGTTTYNVFVSKLNPAGTALIYSTYLGGSSEIDIARGIAVDASGNVFVTGTTTGSGYPVTAGAYHAATTGSNSFVTKLASAGNALMYSTYVIKASATGIAIDTGGNAYVTGSAVTGFITTVGALQTTIGNSTGSNAFALKLNPGGTAASYATFLGGSGPDVGNGIAVDGGGNAYVGGATNSSNFPVANPFQPTATAGQNGFVAKVNAAGSALVYSTYLGGEGTDSVNAIAVDQTGSAYVVGETYSRFFPVSDFAFQPSQTGQLVTGTRQGTAFVTKFVPSGEGIAYSTYLGGSICYPSFCTMHQTETQGDAAYAIAIDAQGHAYVTGIARSPDFPYPGPVDPIASGTFQALSGSDALFVVKVSQGGDRMLYATFVRYGAATSGNTPSGLPYDAGKGIAVDSSGTAYGVGEGAAGFPTTTGSLRTTSAGGTDAVAFKLTHATGTLNLSLNPPNPAALQSALLVASVPGGGSTGTVTFVHGGGATYSAPVSNGNASITVQLQPGIHFWSAIYRNNNINAADSPLMVLEVDPAAVCN
jgi:hypothetical protein